MRGATSAPAWSASIRIASRRCRRSPPRCATGTLASLYRANNAIILGDRLAEKIGARVGSNMTRAGERGRAHRCPGGRGCSAPASALSTKARPMCWSRPAQILSQQTGLVNELRVRVDRPDGGSRRGAAHRARDRLQVGCLAGGARGPAQRLRDPQRHHVHRRRRDPAGGELRHLQHHLDHHAREDARHRHHEVARHPRGGGAAHLRSGGARDRSHRRTRGLGARLRADDRTRHDRDQEPDDRLDPPAARLLLPALCARSGVWRWPRRCLPATSRRARRRACTPSISSGGRHDRSPGKRGAGASARGQRGASDRRRRRHPHPAWRGADHLGARHRPRPSAATSSWRSPGRRAPASPRCSTCSGCSTCRPRARCAFAAERRRTWTRPSAHSRDCRCWGSCSSSTSFCRSSRRSRTSCCRCGRWPSCRRMPCARARNPCSPRSGSPTTPASGRTSSPAGSASA